MEMTNEKDEELFDSLLQFSEKLDQEEEFNQLIEQSFVEFKSSSMMPIYDEYWGSTVVGEIKISADELNSKAAKRRPVLRDPKGGLTAAGRAYFKRKEGSNLKPGVMGPANTPEKMRRKGSFLTRFFTNPSGPMKDDKGRSTRLALSAAAWGEPVPQNSSDAAALAAKGRRLLERYANAKKKKKSLSEDVVVTSHLSTKALINVEVPSYMKGMTGKGIDSVYDSDLNQITDSRRRRLVLEELSNSVIAAKTGYGSYVGGSIRDVKRMGQAHTDMMRIRKKKKNKKSKIAKAKKNVNNG
jgi:hypothetical protein